MTTNNEDWLDDVLGDYGAERARAYANYMNSGLSHTGRKLYSNVAEGLKAKAKQTILAKIAAAETAAVYELEAAEKFARNEVFGAMPISLARYFSDRIKALKAPKKGDV